MSSIRLPIVIGTAIAVAVPIALLLVGVLAPHEATRAAAAVVVAALVVVALGRTRRSPPLERSVALSVDRTHAPLPERPAQLERTLRLSATAADVHWRLRPVLRDVARGLLRERHTVDLDRSGGRAEALLGPDLYEVVRADRPAPPDRIASSGLDENTVVGFVERLRAL